MIVVHLFVLLGSFRLTTSDFFQTFEVVVSVFLLTMGLSKRSLATLAIALIGMVPHVAGAPSLVSPAQRKIREVDAAVETTDYFTGTAFYTNFNYHSKNVRLLLV